MKLINFIHRTHSEKDRVLQIKKYGAICQTYKLQGTNMLITNTHIYIYIYSRVIMVYII